MPYEYSNLRVNPIDGSVSGRSVSEELTIAELDSLPGVYGVQLLDGIVQGSLTVTENVTGGAEFSQVTTSPLAGQVAVLFTSGVNARGILVFNADDDGTEVLIEYNGYGSVTSFENITNAFGSILTNFGDLLVRGVSSLVRMAVGEDGSQLHADSTATNGLSYKHTPHVPVRQTVLSGALDANGQAAWLVAGSGLNVNIDASPTNATLAFASGFGAMGAKDYVERIIADATSAFSSLPADCISYLYGTRTGPGAITWAHSILRPQYNYAFDKTRSSLLNFEGTDGSTSMICAYGNTYTAAGNAQIDTAQFKFGASSLLCDGTGDYIESTNFTSFGNGSWTRQVFARWATLPTAGNNQTIFCGLNAGNFGVLVQLNNTGGTMKTRISLSSNGTSANLASNQLGTSTTWAIDTWYCFTLVFDQVNGKYTLHKDGVADNSVASSALICSTTKWRLGADGSGGTGFNGWLDADSFERAARYPNGTTFTPISSAPTVGGHWFSINEMLMYEITSASASAGTNPGMTARDLLFVGEATAGAASISSATSYAYNARTQLTDQTLGSANTRTSITHNLGFRDILARGFLVNQVTDLGYSPGELAEFLTDTTTGLVGYNLPYDYPDHLYLGFSINDRLIVFSKATPGAPAAATFVRWKLRLHVQRPW